MTMNTIKVCLAGVLAFFLIGCSKDGENVLDLEKDFYQDLKVEYYIEENSMIAYAGFKETDENGDQIELTGDAEINFNGYSFSEFENQRAYFYSWNAAGLYDINFLFKKTLSKFTQNYIRKADTSSIAIQSTTTSFNLSKDTVIAWEGEKVNAYETVALFFKQGSNATTRINVTAFNADSISVPKSVFSGFVADSADLFITRSKLINSISDSDGAGGGRRILEVIRKKRVLLY
jgi:hypothetical protein